MDMLRYSHQKLPIGDYFGGFSVIVSAFVAYFIDNDSVFLLAVCLKYPIYLLLLNSIFMASLLNFNTKYLLYLKTKLHRVGHTAAVNTRV